MSGATDYGRAKAEESRRLMGGADKMAVSMAGHKVMVQPSVDDSAVCVALLGEAITVDIWLDRDNLGRFLRELKVAAAACGVTP